MSEEVAACLTEVRADGTPWRARLCFPPDFSGFQGHFPGQPIVPGVCLIEAVLQLARRRDAQPLRIQSIRNAKFFRPLAPDQAVEVQATSLMRAAGTLEVRAQFTGAAGPVAEIILRLSGALTPPA